MEACPKCNFALAPGAVECPACGVILSKLKAASGVQRPVRPPMPPPLAPPPPQAELPNPYAPPAAPIESPPPPLPAALPAPAAAPAQDVITRLTLATFETLKPWLRFVVGYGTVMNILLIIGGVGMGLLAAEKPPLMVVSLIYLVYGGIGFAVLQPLRRSSEAVTHLPFTGASAGVETFVKEMTVFWRRVGWLCVCTLFLIGFAFLMGLAGGLKGF